jgi:flagella basal body P-ring formation protein FlgA
MFNLNVKTSTPLIRLMQVLCLLFLWHSMGFAQIQAPIKNGATPQVSTGAMQTNLSVMNQQVEQWLSKKHGISSKDVTLQALDPRLQVSSCLKSLLIDHPFSSRETVRVRCAEPVWQLYVQVSLANLSPTPGPKASAPISGASAAANDLKPSGRTVVVPKRFLQRGAVLQAEWLEVVQAPSGPVDSSWLGTVADAQQSELVRDVPAGQPIKSSDIRKAILVRQGQTVLLSVGDKVGYQITVRAEALQDGRFGEQVKLKNPESGRQISGVVTGPNTAKGL